jgi:hypothetical protein
MGLLDAFLKAYQEEGPSGDRDASSSKQSVEKVERGISTKSTNSQHTVIPCKMLSNWLEKEMQDSKEPIVLFLENNPDSNRLGENDKNVENVACVRGNESENLTYLSYKKNSSPLVGSLARASNILNKLPACDSCRACCDWSGYGQMRRGRYCFFSAVLKGKPAWPVPIVEAQRACEKIGF